MNKCFKFICVFFIFFSFSQLIYSNNAEISKELYTAFKLEGFDCHKQLLENTQSENFPYNIVLPFYSEKNEKNPLLLVSLKQNEVITIFPELCNFFSNFKQNKTNVDIILLCVANETSGLQSFLDSEYYQKEIYSIVLDVSDFSEKNSNSFISLIAGGKKTLTPYQMLSNIISVCNKLYLPYNLEMPYFSLYRLDAVLTNPELSFLLSNNIASCGLAIKNHNQCKNIFKLLQGIIEANNIFQKVSDINWDKQYSVMSFFNKTIVLTEKTQIMLFLIVAGVFLLYICLFSFLNKKNLIKRFDLLRSWYLPIILLLINIISFYISQLICVNLIANWKWFPKYTLLFYITISLALFFCLSNIHYFISLPNDNYIFGFLHTVCGVICFFTFSTIDFSLLPLMAIECILIASSRSVKKVLPLIAIFILMLIPFIPFALSLILNCTDNSILSLIDSSMTLNFLLSLFIICFQFIFIRIRVIRNTLGNKYKISKQNIIFSITIPSIILILLICGIFIFNNKTQNITKEKINQQNYIKSNEDYVKIQYKVSENLSSKSYECVLSCDYEIVQYQFEVISDYSPAIIDSNYPWDITSKENSAIFNLDKYPVNPFDFSFKTEKNNNCVLYVTSYIKKSKSQFIKETDVIYFDKIFNGSKYE